MRKPLTPAPAVATTRTTVVVINQGNFASPTLVRGEGAGYMPIERCIRRG